MDTEPDTMEAVLNLSPEEARTYSMILDAASTLPKSDPRFALTVTFTWWLIHRRRRLEQQRVRRRQFYRRLRRLIFMRWHIQKNTVSGAAIAANQNDMILKEDLANIPEKRMWVNKDRSEDFWTKVDQNLLSDEQFRKCFHMSKETFDYVYDELAEQLQKSNTTMRDSLPGKKRLAATIYRLANNAEYMKVSALFGIGKSTTTSLVRDVCEVIVSNLKDKFLTFVGEGHTADDMQRRVNEAATKFGIPKVIGVLGSIDICIIGSSWDWSEASPYISSYHQNYAVTFQAVVDHEGNFCNVFAGSPSSLTNKKILETSGLKKEFVEKLSIPQEESGNLELIAKLVADESYGSEENEDQENPVSSTQNNDTNWLITPTDALKDLTDENEKQLLEEKLSNTRSVFDDSVFRAKSRWKIFHGKNGKISFSADAFETIALACCILHNICELQEDEIDPSWSSEIGPEVYHRKGFPKQSSGDTVVMDDDIGLDEEMSQGDEADIDIPMSGAPSMVSTEEDGLIYEEGDDEFEEYMEEENQHLLA